MQPELTNLLPPERLRALRRDYFMRLATVGIAALSAVVIGSGALLVPSYLFLNREVRSRETQLHALDEQLVSAQGKQTNMRLSALSDSASYLARLATTSSATAVLRGVLSVPRSGITLNGFTYTPPAKATPGKLSLKGVASTRETLRAYDEALAALPFVTNADLPISAYAQDSDIQFTIALTGSLLP